MDSELPPLPRDFYGRDTVLVARQLLGKLLVRRTRGGPLTGRIVEVEAYLNENDPACHAARGMTPSNRAMFGPPGRAYVYPIHSRHCLNAVTEPARVAAAVLIRAVEPLIGMAQMMRRRHCNKTVDLTRGPARLCEAFDIDRRLDHWDLTVARRLWISGPDIRPLADAAVGVTPRIGISAARHLRLRFFVDGNRYVSGRRGDHRRRLN